MCTSEYAIHVLYMSTYTVHTSYTSSNIKSNKTFRHRSTQLFCSQSINRVKFLKLVEQHICYCYHTSLYTQIQKFIFAFNLVLSTTHYHINTSLTRFSIMIFVCIVYVRSSICLNFYCIS